jgi:hypothetical protein
VVTNFTHRLRVRLSAGRTGLLVLPAGALALAAALYFIFAARATNGAFGFPLDDSWIHLSFARTLADTGRFADFSGGPVTSGSTSPLFTLLEAIAWHFTRNEFLIGYGLGIAGLLVSVGSIWRLLRTEHPGAVWPAVLGAVVLATHPKIVGVSVSGMETTTTIALLLFCALQAKRRKWKTVGLAAGLLLWSRPDTLIFTAALALHLLYESVIAKPSDRSKMPQALLTFGALAVGYFVFNWALSGTLFPNSLAAKLEYYRFGNSRFAADLWTFLTAGGMTPAMLLFFVSLCGTIRELVRRRPAPRLYAHLLVVALVAVYWWKLPFLYQDGRYLIPIIPFVIVGMVDGAGRIVEAIRKLEGNAGRAGAIASAPPWAVPLLAGLAIVGLDVSRLAIAKRDLADRCRQIGETQVATAWWCRDHLPSNAIVATHDIGALGFYSGRPIVDVVGLLDREIHGHIGDPRATLQLMRDRRVTHMAFLTDWIEVPNENPLMRTNPAAEEIMQVLPLTSRTKISSPMVRSLNAFAEQRLAAGQTKEAFAALAQASRLEPANARTHYLAGLTLVKVGALDRAECELEISLRDFPDSSKTLSALGQLAYHRGDTLEATRLLRRAVAEDPLNIEALTVLVNLLERQPDEPADLPALRARLEAARSSADASVRR